MHAISHKHLPWCLNKETLLAHCRCAKDTYTICIITALLIFVFELWGARFTQSIALESDAFHVLSDTLMYGVAIVAIIHKGKFAYTAGRISNLTLIIIGFMLIFRGMNDFQTIATRIHGNMLLGIAFIGLLGNAFMSFLLKRTSNDSHDHDAHHGALIHTLGDFGSSLAVCILGILLMIFPHNQWIPYLDPVTAVLIGLWIACEGIRKLK